MKDRVVVKIMDTSYTIVTDEPEEYVERIAKTVDKSMRSILEANDRTSVTMAAVMTAFNLADESIRATDTADNLRSQIKTYLEEIAKAKSEKEDSGREIERLRSEAQTLKNQLARKD